MKRRDIQRGKNTLRIFLIFLFLMNVLSPIAFIWHVEITTKPINGYTTNGFIKTDALKDYHIVAWIMAISTFTTSIIGLYYLNKIIYGKEKERENL